MAHNRWWTCWQPLDDQRELLGEGPAVRRAVEGWPKPGGLGGWFAMARRLGLRLQVRPSDDAGETVHGRRASLACGDPMGPLETRIRARLDEALAPLHLELRNESDQHAGPATESHWNLVLVSAAFEGLTAVRRQRLVYGALQAELADGVHALAMRTLSPAEWVGTQGPLYRDSPPCLGGGKAEG